MGIFEENPWLLIVLVALFGLTARRLARLS